MNENLNIELPRFLALSMKLSEEEFEKEFIKHALVKLYESGKISSGIGARVLKVSRIEFLDILSQYSVSPFDTEDLDRDIENA